MRRFALVAVGLLVGCSSAASEPAPSSTASPDTAVVTTTVTTAITTTTSSEPAPFRWERVMPGDEPIPGGMADVIVGGPGLVAVGADGSGDDYDAAIWTSADGYEWTRVPHDEAVFGGTGDQIMRGIAAGESSLVAVGFDTLEGEPTAAIWTSPDGLVWARVSDQEEVLGGPESQMANGVVASDAGFVMVGNEQDEEGDQDVAVWTSLDGLAWTRVPHDEDVFGGDGLQAAGGVTYGDFGFVAVGYDVDLNQGVDFDLAVWVSPDGVSWSRIPHDESVFGGTGWQGPGPVIAVGSGLVVLGYDEDEGPYDVAIWISTDGTEWARVASDSEALGGEGEQLIQSVIGTDAGLVAGGRDGANGVDEDAAIWISPDGLTWTQLEDEVFGGPGDQEIRGITAFGDLVVAVGLDRSEDEVPTAVVWVGHPTG